MILLYINFHKHSTGHCIVLYWVYHNKTSSANVSYKILAGENFDGFGKSIFPI